MKLLYIPILLAALVAAQIITFLCLNIEKAKEMMTDPKNPIRMSPAPGLDAAFVR